MAPEIGRNSMKIVIVSDTHGGHEALDVMSGDILIHCGDFEDLFTGDEQALASVDAWFGQQQFEHILCIGGNHDLDLERRVGDSGSAASPFQNAQYLHDSGFVYRGVRFHGAPWVPMLDGHAFFADDRALAAAWARIPDDVDVLITHTPPAGILDVSSTGLKLGCRHLADRLAALSPRLHCFGHVHASAGHRTIGGTTYVNAASVNSAFEVVHPPFTIELPDRER